jgi:copper chaperone for superoxide dismutase
MSNLKTKLEFEIQKFESSSIGNLCKSLETKSGIFSTSVDIGTNRLYIETTLPSATVLNLIENEYKSQALLRGMGSMSNELYKKYGTIAAVSIISNYDNRPKPIRGVIRFVQLDEENCAIDGTIDGLSTGKYALGICEYGDLTKGCESIGTLYNPINKENYVSSNLRKYAGDLGSISSDSSERASFRLIDNYIKVWDIIGRSACIFERENSGYGRKIACGLVARSAGLFENFKKICLCSGQTVWEEKESLSKRD